MRAWWHSFWTEGASYDLIPKDTTSFTERCLVNDTDYIAVLTREYEYLLGKNISSLTFEKAYWTIVVSTNIKKILHIYQKEKIYT